MKCSPAVIAKVPRMRIVYSGFTGKIPEWTPEYIATDLKDADEYVTQRIQEGTTLIFQIAGVSLYPLDKRLTIR